jgi:aspartate beta-hydroxylase
VSPEVINSLGQTRAHHLLPLRDAFLALDSLPTVQRGKAALALGSVFDVLAAPAAVFKRPSPYTHPLQTPSFFVPGVPARAFYDAPEFGFTQQLEQAYPLIRAELEQVLKEQRESFQTYRGGHGGLHEGWNNFFFYLFGKRNERSAQLCPVTMAVLDAIPRLEHTMAMFAALNPHSGLPPHTGPFNGILRVHLPLIVPPGCELTVGGETRQWQEGKVTVFDDSFVHSVHNHSDSIRVVLFFTVYHPAFTDAEVPVMQRFNDAWQALPVTRLYEKLQHVSVSSNVVLSETKQAAPQRQAG